MKKLAMPVAVSLMVILAGCSSVSVTQDYDPDFDFTSFKTFNVAPYESKMGMDQITYGEIKDAITKVLTAKGMSESNDKSDFVVTMATAKQQQTDIEQTGPGWWGTDVYQYEEGTLLVDFFNAKDQKLVWRGTAKGELDDNPSQQEKLANIESTITQMLAPFPPKSKS